MTAAYMMSGYANGTTLPNKLGAIGGMSYYSACNALQSMGIMLTLPLSGKLGDTFGRKIIVVIGILLQALSQAGMALTDNPLLFTILYTTAGCGSGFYLSMAYALIADVMEPQECPKYFGFITAANAVGCLIGPVIAGQLVSRSLVPLGFCAYMIPMAIAMIGIIVLYPNVKANLMKGAKFDFPGLLLIVMTICCLVIWLSLGGTLFPLFSPLGIALVILGIIFAILMVKRELKVTNPAVPLTMFRNKRFTTAFVCQLFAAAYAVMSAAYIIVYCMEVMQLPATQYSMVTIPQTVIQFLVGLFAGGWMAKKMVSRVRQVGLLSMVASLVALTIMFLLKPTSPFFVCCIATGIGGIGQATMQVSFIPLFASEIDQKEMGAAQSMFSFGGVGGSCIFSSLAGIILTFTGSYNNVFLLGAVCAGIALVIGIFRFKMPAAE